MNSISFWCAMTHPILQCDGPLASFLSKYAAVASIYYIWKSYAVFVFWFAATLIKCLHFLLIVYHLDTYYIPPCNCASDLFLNNFTVTAKFSRIDGKLRQRIVAMHKNNKPITEIADELGVSVSSHFI